MNLIILRVNLFLFFLNATFASNIRKFFYTHKQLHIESQQRGDYELIWFEHAISFGFSRFIQRSVSKQRQYIRQLS